MRRVFFLCLVHFAIYGSETPNFDELQTLKSLTFFLSTNKSGSNLISSSLSAITRKPISWLNWGNEVFDPSSGRTDHPSYNRLQLPLASDSPLLYRTHYDYDKLMGISSDQNKLIFVTRNPKELIYRAFFLTSASLSSENPDQKFIDTFLIRYLKAFKAYEAWSPENRCIVFYEDFIRKEDAMLLGLLEFMGEEPTFFDDFQRNKQEYMTKMLESYQKQHKSNFGGSSSRGSPKAIYYTRNASPETLRYIDEYIQETEPLIWKKHLQRFQ